MRRGAWPRTGDTCPARSAARRSAWSAWAASAGRTAGLLRAFGARVLAADPAVAAAPAGVALVGLDELLARSDVVSLHVPLVPATAGLLGAAEIARMRPGAMVVNTARGGLVDEAALLARAPRRATSAAPRSTSSRPSRRPAARCSRCRTSSRRRTSPGSARPRWRR